MAQLESQGPASPTPSTQPGVGTVREVSGRVLEIQDDGTRAPVTEGQRIELDDRIQTLANGAIVIEFDSGGRLELGPQRSVVVDSEVAGVDAPDSIAADSAVAADQATQGDAAAPEGLDGLDPEAIAAALASGADPTQLLEATAAGRPAAGRQAALTGPGEDGLSEGSSNLPQLQRIDVDVPPPIGVGELGRGEEADREEDDLLPDEAIEIAPVAIDDVFTTPEDTPLTNMDVLTNDFDPNGDEISICEATTNIGTVTVNADGTLNYTPPPDFTGPVAIIYVIQDTDGNKSNPATVTVNVTPVNDPPVAQPDNYSTPEDVPLVVPVATGVLANDTDVDGDTLAVNTPVTGTVNAVTALRADGTALDTQFASTTPITAPVNGTLALDSDGSFVYTPNENFNGTDSFVYQITDGNGGTATTTATITVTPVNDPPTAVNDPLGAQPDAYTTLEDTPLVVPVATGVLANDSDVEGDPIVASTTPVSGPSNGTLALNADGSFSYTPTANFNGTDSFVYQVSDDNGGTATATATINVTPVNDPPTAVNDPLAAQPDAYTTLEDVPLVVPVATGVLANDSDVDGDTLTVNTAPITNTVNGTLALNTDGSFTYTPNANFNGTDSFVYQALDGNGGTATATASINITPVNDPPVAVNDPLGAQPDAYTTLEDTPLVVPIGTGVLANDTDVEGDTLVANTTPVTAPANGTLALAADGSFTYTPTANFNGTDSFVYQVSDGNGGTATATATITVTPVNDPPVAVNDPLAAQPDAYTTLEDVPLVIPVATGVLANDVDVDGDTLVVNTTPVTGTVNGALALAADGSFTYTPNANFNGTDSFVYQVSDGNGGTATALASINITPVNDPPVAVDDPLGAQPDAYTTLEDTPLVVPIGTGVLANDTDVEGDTLVAITTPVTAPANGALALAADGSFTYTPNANFNGTDSFVYQVSDGNGGTASATATITVTPVNDPPTAVDDPLGAQPDAFTTQEDVPLVVPVATGVLANDSDVDGDTLTVNTTPVTNPVNGTLALNADGSFTYTPNADFNGTDSFVYQALDGNGGTATATATITVTPVNDAPNAVDDTGTTDEDTPLVVTAANGILSNDTDVEGNTLSVASVNGVAGNVGNAFTTGTGASLTVQADGSYTYDPTGSSTLQALAVGATTTDSFTYTANDGTATASATVTITITGVNDPPVALPDSFTTPEDTVLGDAPVVSVLPDNGGGADFDPDGDTIIVNPTVLRTTANGELFFVADGTFRYQPNGNFNGTDSFDYQISDGNGGTASTTVTITVTPVNDPPIAQPDAYIGLEDAPLVVPVATGILNNDFDIDGGTITAETAAVSGPSNGTLALNADGSFTYTPNADFFGTDSFNYRISDGAGGTATSTATITVQSVPDIPNQTNDIQVPLGTNLMLIVDRSLSMNSDPAVQGFTTRLDLLRNAVGQLMQAFSQMGDLNIRIVEFSTTATASNWFSGTTAIADATTFLGNLTPAGTTNYSNAISTAIADYSTNAPANAAGLRNISYFLTDGNPFPPSNELSATDIANFNTFAAANNLASFAVGLGQQPGVNINNASFQAIATGTDTVFGGPGPVENPVVVTTESELANVLLARTGQVEGNVLTNAQDVTGIISLNAVNEGRTFTYNLATNTITEGTTVIATSSLLVLTTAINGELRFNFADGGYTYRPPGSNTLTQATTETYNVTVTDAEGQTAVGAITVNVSPATATTTQTLMREQSELQEAVVPEDDAAAPAAVAFDPILDDAGGDAILGGTTVEDVSTPIVDPAGVSTTVQLTAADVGGPVREVFGFDNEGASAEGDVIDISDVLDAAGFDQDLHALEDFLSLTETENGDLSLGVDLTGSGSNYTEVLVLHTEPAPASGDTTVTGGLPGASVDQMLNDGVLVV